MGCLFALGSSNPVAADVYSYEKDGVVHFTNIPPKGTAQHWKTEFRSGPGKAKVGSGAGGWTCKESRRDVVPARDKSPERVHRYDDILAEAARAYALPVAFLRAIMYTESDYDPFVVSCAGARGLMQIMPSVEEDQRIHDVFDPRRNVLGAARMLRVLANRYRGDITLTIAGFHAGMGAIQKYNGVPPYATTQWYVQTVLKRYYNYKQAIG